MHKRLNNFTTAIDCNKLQSYFYTHSAEKFHEQRRGKTEKNNKPFFQIGSAYRKNSGNSQIKNNEDLTKDKSESAVFILKGAKFYLLLEAKSKNSLTDGKKQKYIDYREGKVIIGEYDLRSKRIKMESKILQINDFSVYEQDISMNSVYLIRTPQ